MNDLHLLAVDCECILDKLQPSERDQIIPKLKIVFDEVKKSVRTGSSPSSQRNLQSGNTKSTLKYHLNLEEYRTLKEINNKRISDNLVFSKADKLKAIVWLFLINQIMLTK